MLRGVTFASRSDEAASRGNTREFYNNRRHKALGDDGLDEAVYRHVRLYKSCQLEVVYLEDAVRRADIDGGDAVTASRAIRRAMVDAIELLDL